MLWVFPSHSLAKHEMTDAERTISSVKLTHLTTRQVHLPKGNGNSRISPNGKRPQTEG
jgi:hypothetical protein